MKRTFSWIPAVALWGATVAAQGQIEVTWSLVHNRTVLMEPVRPNLRRSSLIRSSIAVMRRPIWFRRGSPLGALSRSRSCSTSDSANWA